MRDYNRKAMKIAGALIGIGLVLCLVAFARMDFNISEMNSLRFETNEYTVEESFTDISIDSAEGDVHLLPSQDNTCRVVCMEGDKISHTVSVKNNTLTIERVDKRKWYEHIGIYWGGMEIMVYVPQTEYDSLAVASVSGDVEIPDDFSFHTASVVNTSGDVKFCAAVGGELSIKTVSGDLYAENVNPMSLEVQSTSGEIILDSVLAVSELRAKTVSGDIVLRGCDAGSLRLKSTSGDVSGTLLSGKDFITDTTSGEVKVPGSGGDGKCEVKTTSGDIHLEVE